ncbi:hypothetical protein DPMN_173588 [Dreissena polymorpha]|uniref:Uncharacterized protein n=1 Tax=Dreissena polymorpha TaxID=45954 RepID=A0A9D4IFM9_DREPO|nr:hypothetical protein DPMN_173588 [Dreissena polymorpha]
MAETALKNMLEAVYRENAQNCAHCDTKNCPAVHTQPAYSRNVPEDPDIQILLDRAKDLYSSLLRGKITLADDMLCDLYQTREGYREET